LLKRILEGTAQGRYDALLKRIMAYHLPLEQRLIDCPEREIGVWLPMPLSARLDGLARIGHYAWAPTTRKEIISALLLAGSANGKKLKLLFKQYDAARVLDVFVEGIEQWRFLYAPNARGPRVQLSLFEESMPPDEEPVADPTERLATARAYRTGMLIDSPLAGRLDLLVQVAAEAGMKATRKDLLAALILDANTDGAKLAKQLARYWHGTVGDAVIPGLPTDPIVSWPERRTARDRRERAERAQREAKAAKPRHEPVAPPGARRSVPRTVRVSPGSGPKGRLTSSARRARPAGSN
jgi:hypothetical protein